MATSCFSQRRHARINPRIRAVAQLVARIVRDDEVAGSIPVSPIFLKLISAKLLVAGASLLTPSAFAVRSLSARPVLTISEQETPHHGNGFFVMPSRFSGVWASVLFMPGCRLRNSITVAKSKRCWHLVFITQLTANVRCDWPWRVRA